MQQLLSSWQLQMPRYRVPESVAENAVEQDQKIEKTKKKKAKKDKRKREKHGDAIEPAGKASVPQASCSVMAEGHEKRAKRKRLSQLEWSQLESLFSEEAVPDAVSDAMFEGQNKKEKTEKRERKGKRQAFKPAIEASAATPSTPSTATSSTATPYTATPYTATPSEEGDGVAVGSEGDREALESPGYHTHEADGTLVIRPGDFAIVAADDVIVELESPYTDESPLPKAPVVLQSCAANCRESLLGQALREALDELREEGSLGEEQSAPIWASFDDQFLIERRSTSHLWRLSVTGRLKNFRMLDDDLNLNVSQVRVQGSQGAGGGLHIEAPELQISATQAADAFQPVKKKRKKTVLDAGLDTHEAQQSSG